MAGGILSQCVIRRSNLYTDGLHSQIEWQTGDVTKLLIFYEHIERGELVACPAC
jgi:hypothetical protein